MKRIIYLTILYVFVFCSASMAKTTTVTHPEKEICKGESVTLTPDASGDTYLWTPGSETTKTVVKTPVADTEYVCKVTKKGGSTDTGNLITLGDFEFPPSQVDNNKSAQNRLGDWISYEYLNFDKGISSFSAISSFVSAKPKSAFVTMQLSTQSPNHGCALAKSRMT